MKQLLYFFLIFLMMVAIVSIIGLIVWAFALLNGEVAFFVALLFVFVLITLTVVFGSKNGWFECC